MPVGYEKNHPRAQKKINIYLCECGARFVLLEHYTSHRRDCVKAKRRRDMREKANYHAGGRARKNDTEEAL